MKYSKFQINLIKSIIKGINSEEDLKKNTETLINYKLNEHNSITIFISRPSKIFLENNQVKLYRKDGYVNQKVTQNEEKTYKN